VFSLRVSQSVSQSVSQRVALFRVLVMLGTASSKLAGQLLFGLLTTLDFAGFPSKVYTVFLIL